MTSAKALKSFIFINIAFLYDRIYINELNKHANTLKVITLNFSTHCKIVYR